MERLTSRIGFWSAILSFVFGMGYIVFQFADWAGLTPQPWPSITLMFPSFWLALSFVILMISIYHYAPDERKIWGHIALAVAIMYATLNTAVYFVQMTVVFPFTLSGHAGEVDFVRLVGGNTVPSFMYALDALGYSLMSIATLFAAPVFAGGKLERWIRWSLVANGLLTPALLLQLNFPTFSIAALWAITFPIATALLAMLFKREMK